MKANKVFRKGMVTKGLIAGTALAAVFCMAGCGNRGATETDAVTEVEEDPEVFEEEMEDEEITEEEVVEETGGPTEEIMSASILDNKIQIGDVVGVNGEMTVSVLFDNGFSFDDLTEDYLVYGGENSSGTVSFPGENDNRASISYENASESSASLKDCILTVNTVYYDTNETSEGGIYFAGGIGAGSTVSDVEEALGEPYSREEGDDLVYTYYQMDENIAIKLQVSFDRNTSTVAMICMSEEEIGNIAVEEECFPYIISVYTTDDGEKKIDLESATYTDQDTFDKKNLVDDVAVLEEKINPYFARYYNGELTKEDYLASIVPILEEAGFYKGLAGYIGFHISYFVWDGFPYEFNGSWSEIIESALKGDLSDEIYEARYSPLESLDPRTE